MLKFVYWYVHVTKSEIFYSLILINIINITDKGRFQKGREFSNGSLRLQFPKVKTDLWPYRFICFLSIRIEISIFFTDKLRTIPLPLSPTTKKKIVKEFFKLDTLLHQPIVSPIRERRMPRESYIFLTHT